MAIVIARRHTSHSAVLLFIHAPPTTEIYTLSLHDALPISDCRWRSNLGVKPATREDTEDTEIKSVIAGSVENRLDLRVLGVDRKSTRLNSSHVEISYAVFCLKKKKKNKRNNRV